MKLDLSAGKPVPDRNFGDLPDEEPDGVRTISKWCQNWLREEYHTEAVYLPNGIDPSFYPKRGRDLQGKIRILIEGDCSAEHKKRGRELPYRGTAGSGKIRDLVHVLQWKSEILVPRGPLFTPGSI